MKGILITTEDEMSVVSFEGRALVDAISEAIDCDMIEIVRPWYLDEPYVMIVDESGLLKRSPRVNRVGCALYATRIHYQPIVGNIVIVQEVMTEDGIELAGLTQKQIETMTKRFMTAYNFLKEKEHDKKS